MTEGDLYAMKPRARRMMKYTFSRNFTRNRHLIAFSYFYCTYSYSPFRPWNFLLISAIFSLEEFL
jgi:magnesium-transporting ATPase (P-type)